MLLEPPFCQHFVEVGNRPVVEAPLALFDEQMKVLSGNSIEWAHVSFGLVPEVLNAVDVIGLISKELRVVNAQMTELRDIQCIIRSEAVSVDDRIRFDFVSNDRKKRCRWGIWDDCNVNAAISLQKPKNRNFARGAVSTLAFAGSAKIALVNLNLARQKFGCFSRQMFKDHFA